MIKTDKRAQLFYIVGVVILILLSFIFFIFEVYEITLVLTIMSVVCYFVLLINLYGGKDKEKASKGKFIFLGLFRFLLIGIGLVSSAFLIKYLNDNKYSFLYLLLGLIPIFFSLFTVILRSKYE